MAPQFNQKNPPPHPFRNGLTRRTVWQPPFIFSPSLQSQKFWQEILAGQAKKPLALEQLTEGWGSSEGKVRSGQAGYFARTFYSRSRSRPVQLTFTGQSHFSWWMSKTKPSGQRCSLSSPLMLHSRYLSHCSSSGRQQLTSSLGVHSQSYSGSASVSLSFMNLSHRA